MGQPQNKNTLTLCSVCKKPLIFLTWLLDGKNDDHYDPQGPPLEYLFDDHYTQEYVGPNTHPLIEKWCDGKCEADLFSRYVVEEEERMLGVWEDDGGAIPKYSRKYWQGSFEQPQTKNP